MRRKAVLVMISALSLAALAPAATASSGSGDKEAPPAIAIQQARLQPPAIVTDRVEGLKITVTQVMYPGVPDRAACRFVVRSVNSGSATISTYALMRTLDREKSELNTWMVPTGALAPGQASERLYSCKTAQYLVLDQESLGGWPGRCIVNGEERAPCPLTLALEANLNIVSKQ
ncbi:hypothetical protein [Magnetospirillum aberrantis]|uniref:Uncharacterized protein n=1 Tax=Magnetospirillum aberrantis SpK TaxID=908842 RepID=A0A7C9QRL4_9PROT|nr:hypothetical protein [Magnetospirillum aberrantis]NFV78903.1 hypothetical protein [Magnetospirillum aberrantis SpK]